MRRKRIAIVALATLLVFVFSSMGFCKEVILYGSQQSGTSVFRDAKLKSTEVTLTSKGKITKIEGGEAGFWLVKKSGQTFVRFRDFWREKVRDGKVVGTVLPKGTYKAYPNVPPRSSRGRLKIYIETK